MLDIAPGSDSGPCTRMPLDFTPYLLSASPPASSFEFHSYGLPNGFSQRFPPYTLPSLEPPAYSKPYGGGSLNSRRQGPLKSIIIRPEGEDSLAAGDMAGKASDCSGCTAASVSSALADYEVSSTSISPSSPCSPGRLRKRVSFADSLGKPLTEVRLMRESSDEPPRIPSELLACITQGATAGVTDKPPLKLTFAQPACDYLAFRDRINQNCVSLENVLLNDYTVQGTIKVKNVGFEKRVFVRWTNDLWETSTDVPASYVPGPGDVPGRPSIFDTFQFQFEVPPSSDTSKSVQFAVCFRSNGDEYWDNNFGKNYVIVWETYSEPSTSNLLQGNSNNNNSSDKVNPFFFGSNDLADYACWNHIDSSTPYY